MKAPTLFNSVNADGTGFVIRGGLHKLAENVLPYFSCTYTEYDRYKDVAGGHSDEILRQAPDLKPLMLMHLSDINGVPEHAVENSWYWLAGASTVETSMLPTNLAPAGASTVETLVETPTSKTLNGTSTTAVKKPHFGEQFHGGSGYVGFTPDQCLGILASYVRISLDEAKGLLKGAESLDNAKAAKMWLTVWIEAQKPRWKEEADDCIAMFDLKVYGS